MAAIEQIITIATNRSGAASDVYTALSGTTAIVGLPHIDNQHLDTGTAEGQLLVQGAQTPNMIPDPNNPGQMIPNPDGSLASDTTYITRGTGPNRVVVEGTGSTSVLRIEDLLNTSNTGGFVDVDATAGTVRFANPRNVQLGDAHSFSNTTARNAADTIEWHQGDIALIPGGPTVTDSGFQYTAFIDSTNFRVANGWNTTTDASLLNFEVGDTLQFHASNGTVAGSTTGGTDFVVTAIDQFGSTNQAQVTLNRGTFPADGVSPLPSNGDDIFIVMGGGDGATYIYTGTDQTSAGVTDDDDWTQVETQFAGITTSLASNAAINPLADAATDIQIPSFQNGSMGATGLGQVVYTPAAGDTPASLSINGQSITVGGGGGGDIIRNHYGYNGPALTVEGLDPSNPQAGDEAQTFNIATTERDTVAMTGNWTLNRGSAAVPTADGWPQNVSLYGAGDKFFYGTDWTINSDGSMITVVISVERRRQLAGGPDQNGNFSPNSFDLVLEVETLTS